MGVPLAGRREAMLPAISLWAIFLVKTLGSSISKPYLPFCLICGVVEVISFLPLAHDAETLNPCLLPPQA